MFIRTSESHKFSPHSHRISPSVYVMCIYLASSTESLEHLDGSGGSVVGGGLLWRQTAVHLHLQCEVSIHLLWATELRQPLYCNSVDPPRLHFNYGSSLMCSSSNLSQFAV